MHHPNLQSKPSRPKLARIRYVLAGLALLVHPALAQLTREPNTTLHFPTEGPTSEYVLEDVLPGIPLHRPVAVKTPPGETNRLFIVERNGRILVVNDLTNTSAEVFLDIRDHVHASSWTDEIENRRTEGLSSLAFHPDFATNGRFFVTYNTVTTTSQGEGHHNRISEFRASQDGRTASPESEIPLITQFDEGPGHNYNDLHFGPDGYLYVALGDEGDGGNGDDFNNAQKIDKDFFSGIIRLDVDNRVGNLAPNPHPASAGNYRIPADNPFVGRTNFNGVAIETNKVRTEFYAVGLRNPWRMSFDPLTGNLYEGDVGQHDREEINLIVKGGNYGWAFRQGTLIGPKGAGPSDLNLNDPIWEYGTGYGPEQGFSVTAGVVYRGTLNPSLSGNLIFADFQSGNVWALDVDRQPVTRPQRLLARQFIAGFGYDPRTGEVLLVDHGNVSLTNAGKILRLTLSKTTVDLPTKLSKTGIFRDLRSLTPEAGIVPFDVNLPFWSDGAIKSRWISVPALSNKITFAPELNWSFPTGTVWIKHFELETRQGDPSSRKRIETRVLVKTEANGYGMTYKWNDAGTDADLVSDIGEDRAYTVERGGITSTQIWRFPSQQECITCHNPAAGFTLGFYTAQLNKNVTHGKVTDNQIAQLARAGYFTNITNGVPGLRALAQPDDTSVSLTYRAKSYFAANCGYCHQPGGTAGVNAFWDGRITTPFSRANILWGALYDRAVPDEKVVTPGRPDKSAVVRRISTLEHRDRMPPIGSSVIDEKAVALLTQWITQETPRFEGYNQWAARVFNEATEESARTAIADPDGDGANNYAEYLVGTNPLDTQSKLPLGVTLQNGDVTLAFPHPVNRAVLLESAMAAGATNWATIAAPANQMRFPAEAFTNQVTIRTNGPQHFYRARVIEP